MSEYEGIEIDDSLENISTSLTVMSVMSVTSRQLEKKSDVASAFLLKILEAGDERLITDAVNLTDQHFASEVHQPGDKDE
jgi:hypothetical protein